MSGPSGRSSRGGAVLRGDRGVKCECSERGWGARVSADTLRGNDEVTGSDGRLPPPERSRADMGVSVDWPRCSGVIQRCAPAVRAG